MLAIPGCIGADAELRQVEYNGQTTPVLNFRMAYNRRPKKGGEKQEPLWISVSLWGDRAEKLASMLPKGKYVTVHGWLDLKTREQRDGNVTEVVIHAEHITFQGQGQQASSGNARAATAYGGPPKARIAAPLDDEDIPF